jgi:hypothetical protein
MNTGSLQNMTEPKPTTQLRLRVRRQGIVRDERTFIVSWRNQLTCKRAGITDLIASGDK